MKKILLQFAHPALERSRTNARLFREVSNLEGVTPRDLYELYPRFDIDIGREQDLLLEHDIIVFQHPFFWYSAPALVKEWIDLVLKHGWAYGAEGNALHGKVFLQAFSAGGSESAYGRDGSNSFTLRELLRPFEQTARLCGMTYLAPIVHFGVHNCTQKTLADRVGEYRQLLEALRDERIDLESAESAETLTLDLVKD